jgi:two-component system sensor histidine kinase DevS
VTAQLPSLEAPGDSFPWSMVEAAPYAILVSAAGGEVTYANDHAAELFGYPLDTLVGLRVEDLLPDGQRSVHVAHRTRYRADPVARAMAPAREVWAKPASGSLVPVEVALSPLQVDGEMFVVAFIENISRRLVVEEQLHRVLATLDAIDDGVFIFDATTLRYSYVNEGAVRLTGYRRDELLTMSPLHVNPATSDAEYRGLVETLSASTTAAIVRQATLIRKDGTQVAVEKTLWLAPKARNKTNWVISLTRDVTARRTSESAQQHSREVLQAAEEVLAVASDRERIARDLHDTIIQRLFGDGMRLQAVLATIEGPARAKVQSVIDGLDETIRQLRLAIFSLQGDDRGAPGKLRRGILAVTANAASALGFEPQIEFDGPIETVADEVAGHLLPALTEALSNIAQHAHASSVEISLRVGARVTMTVADDGVGPPTGSHSGLGLSNMTQRALALHGTFALTARDSGGSILVWDVPATTPQTPRPDGDAPGIDEPASDASVNDISTSIVRKRHADDP